MLVVFGFDKNNMKKDNDVGRTIELTLKCGFVVGGTLIYFAQSKSVHNRDRMAR
jgi:hypothetical protein